MEKHREANQLLRKGSERWTWNAPNRDELRARCEAVRDAWERERVGAGRGGRLSQAAVIELALRLGLGALEEHFGLVTPGDRREGSGSEEGGGTGPAASSEL